MTPKQFTDFGVALYGETSWKQQLALDLAINRRTVGRYANGQWPIPEGVAADLINLAGKRAEALTRLLGRAQNKVKKSTMAA